MADSQHTTTWPDLAIGLYDRLTGRGAEIIYDFKGMKIQIPSGTGQNAQHAEWQFDGSLAIRTQESAEAPK